MQRIEKKKREEIIMNSIRAELSKTKYALNEHLNIFIDGIRIDSWISQKIESECYMDLIPTWLGWMVYPQEQKYVWDKTRESEYEKSIVPLLVCPDDLDFSCTVIVCEVKYTDDIVEWTKIGLDLTGFPEYIGKDIQWFDSVPVLQFTKKEYENCVMQFSAENL